MFSCILIGTGDPYGYRREAEEGNSTSKFLQDGENKCTTMENQVEMLADDFMSAGADLAKQAFELHEVSK